MRKRPRPPDGTGKALPTEAEWGLAARGGLTGATCTCGERPEAPGERLANYWHGDFPWRSERGYGATTPVGSYSPSGYGLSDMASNVWEWTSDWYVGHRADAAPDGLSSQRSKTGQAPIQTVRHRYVER